MHKLLWISQTIFESELFKDQPIMLYCSAHIIIVTERLVSRNKVLLQRSFNMEYYTLYKMMIALLDDYINIFCSTCSCSKNLCLEI